MTRARDIANLVDANGDIVAGALDNVPAADLVNDTTPQLGGVLDTNGNAINDANGVELQHGGTTKLTTGGNGVTIDGSGANYQSTAHTPAIIASGSYGGGIAMRDTKEMGFYQTSNGDETWLYANRDTSSDTPEAARVLHWNAARHTRALKLMYNGTSYSSRVEHMPVAIAILRPTININGYQISWTKIGTMGSSGHAELQFSVVHQGDHNYSMASHLHGQVHQWSGSTGNYNYKYWGNHLSQTFEFRHDSSRQIWMKIHGEWSYTTTMYVYRFSNVTLDGGTYQASQSPPSGTSRSVSGSNQINGEYSWGS